MKQKHLILNLVRNNNFTDIFGCAVSLYNIEHVCEHGIVDMVFKGTDTIFPVEVKVGKGKHDLIGQIDKYVNHFTKQKILGHWNTVQGVTLCKKYDKFTLQTLKNNKIITLMYDCKFKLVQI